MTWVDCYLERRQAAFESENYNSVGKKSSFHVQSNKVRVDAKLLSLNQENPAFNKLPPPAVISGKAGGRQNFTRIYI